MICAQTRVAGVSVSQVARRYDVNANQVFNWLKDPCFRSDEVVENAVFLPVEIVGERVAADAAPAPCHTAEGRIDLQLSGGHRVTISGGYDAEALARLLRGLLA